MTFHQIIQSVGHYGEKYLARTREEFFRVLSSGSGAGTITASTVLLKFLIIWLKLPLLAEAALFGLNYAGCFLLMQCLGFRLATKQPALLAVTLVQRRTEAPKKPLLIQVLAITRSQFAATAGNFIFVVASMLVFHLCYLAYRGVPFISPAAAAHSITSLDPFHGGTLAYGALTGGLLWCASLASGWAGIASRRIRLAALLVPRPFLACRPWLRTRVLLPLLRQGAGIGFNVSLAFLLCAIPYLGTALGLPLDVRHFTLSSGLLALSVYSVGFKSACALGLLPASIGIVLIGCLNFGVSFMLSLIAAISTSGLEWRRSLPELRNGILFFLRTPLHFIFPPRATGR